MTLETKDQIHEAMIALGEAARAAMRELGSVPAEAKNTALREAAKAIRASKTALLAAKTARRERRLESVGCPVAPRGARRVRRAGPE